MTTPSSAFVRPRPARRHSRQRQEELWGWACASPWILGFLLFTAGPMLFSLFISTMDWAGYGAMKFVGLSQWQQAFTDPDTLTSLKASFLYAIFAVPAGMTTALAIALVMNENVRGKSLLRAIYFMPSVVSGLATTYVFILIFGKNSMLNGVLSGLGIPRMPWLTEPGWARASIIIMGLWSVGTSMIIYLAGLKAVPQHLYEAARIDGANSVNSFFAITLPMLSPTLFFTLTTGIIGSLQIFTTGYVFGPGPEGATYFIVLRIWYAAFQWFKMGFASTLAWMLFAIIMGITVLQLWLAKYWVYYESSV
jgi:multiple sugar transport system permease protein